MNLTVIAFHKTGLLHGSAIQTFICMAYQIISLESRSFFSSVRYKLASEYDDFKMVTLVQDLHLVYGMVLQSAWTRK
jgi:hypothetical protein